MNLMSPSQKSQIWNRGYTHGFEGLPMEKAGEFPTAYHYKLYEGGYKMGERHLNEADTENRRVATS